MIVYMRVKNVETKLDMIRKFELEEGSDFEKFYSQFNLENVKNFGQPLGHCHQRETYKYRNIGVSIQSQSSIV